MQIRERDIEFNVNRYAHQTGWVGYKFSSPQHAGVPDRLYIKNGKTIYIEFKAPGKKPRKLQEKVFEDMRRHGALVFVVDDIDEGKAVLDVN